MALGMARVFGGMADMAANVMIDATLKKLNTFTSPYTQGGYEGPNPLSPTSVARLFSGAKGDGTNGRAFGVDPSGLASMLGVESQETRQIQNTPNTQGMMTAAVGATAAIATRNKGMPTQESRDMGQYDPSRLKAEIAELADRHRAHGHDTRPKDETSGLPMQVIRNAQGEILMKGRAESVEGLIATKMREAETTNDPNKKIVSLAGAQLDERTLGRKLNLEGMDFKNLDARAANLGGAIIKDCKFQNCDMESVNLKGASVSLTSFDTVNMNGFVGDNKTKFENCGMSNVHMQDANAPGVKFDNIRAERWNIQGANFAGSSFTHVHAENLWAKDTNMNGAKVGDFHVTGRESNMDGWKINNAQVHNASFGTPQYGIPMRKIEAQNTNWTDVQFNRSDLSGSDFTRGTFTRVDMRNVVTPHGPMQMKEANLTGLTAGVDAQFTAHKATHSGITMMPQEDFVFRGTAPIERAAKAAISVRSEVANITSADGKTTQEMESQNTLQAQQQMMAKKRMQMAMAPTPYNQQKGKGTPWG